MLHKNPDGVTPAVSDTPYISESAVIMGNVEINKKVYIAHNATIRADEPGSRIIIGKGCNIGNNCFIGFSSVVLFKNKRRIMVPDDLLGDVFDREDEPRKRRKDKDEKDEKKTNEEDNEDEHGEKPD